MQLSLKDKQTIISTFPVTELYYERNPDKDPRNKEKKPEEDEEKSWWDFT